MRNKERIPIVLAAILDTPNALKLWVKESGSQTIGEVMSTIRENSWKIYKYWTENYDQRFGQMLFNLGYTPDGLYHTEATDWLIERKIVRRQDVAFWGTYGLAEKEFREIQEFLEKETGRIRESYGEVDMGEFLEDVHAYRDAHPKKKYKPISSLTTDHINAIIDNEQLSKDGKYYKLFKEELEYRNEES